MRFVRKYKKVIAIITIQFIVFQVVYPTALMANSLTSAQSTDHQPSGAGGDIVNPMTGGMNYSVNAITIPGPGMGYNISFNYNSDDVKMINEASCIGVGWKMTVNSITRNLVDKPDDHAGKLGIENPELVGFDKAYYRRHLKPYEMHDLGLGDLSGAEFGGLPIDPDQFEKPKVPVNAVAGSNTAESIDYNAHIYYSNYKGIGFRIGTTLSSEKTTTNVTQTATTQEKTSESGSISYDSQTGFVTSAGLGYENFNFNLTKSAMKGFQGVSMRPISGLSFSGRINSMVSSIDYPMTTKIKQLPFKLGMNLTGQTEKNTDGSTTVKSFPSSLNTGDYTSLPKMKFFNSGLLGSAQLTITKSDVTKKNESRESFGYKYRGEVTDLDLAACDYIQYPFEHKKGSPFIPFGKSGQDVFIQSSNGAGGMFKLRSTEVETFSPSQSSSTTKLWKIGGEFGFNAKEQHVQLGVDVARGSGTNKTGGITSGANKSELTNSNVSKAATYFVKPGVNVHPRVKNTLDSWGGDEAKRISTKSWGIGKTSMNVVSNSLHDENTTYKRNNDNLNKMSFVQALNHKEAVKIGRSKTVGYIKDLAVDALLINKRQNHIAEFNTIEPGGTVYTYGEACYVNSEFSTTFAMDHPNGNFAISKNIVDIPTNNINTQKQYTFAKSDKPTDLIKRNGVTTEYLNETGISEYASHWLLSCITSKDYFDSDGVLGYTKDDQGSFVLFKYATSHENRKPFSFRFPYEGALLQQGIKGDPSDDMGFVKQGSKEVKWLKSIETKTHIAEFFYDYDVADQNTPSDPLHRKDGYPAKSQEDDPNGGIDKSKDNLWRLDHIKLYVKARGTQKKKCIQTVTLHQDYSLMPGAPDNINHANGNPSETGRLTFKSLHTTFYNSTIGENYKYEFDYGTNNPSFNLENVDRWGDYKENINASGNPINGLYPYKDKPYTKKDGLSVAPWILQRVQLPSGGTLEFEYENRDYAHVKDKKATKMYDIVGVDDFPSNTSSQYPPPSIQSAENRKITSQNNFSEGMLINKDHIIVPLDPSLFNSLTPQKDLDNDFYIKYLEPVKNEILVKAYIHIHSRINYSLTTPENRERDFEYVEFPVGLDNSNNDGYSVFFDGGKPYGKFKYKKIFPIGNITALNMNSLANTSNLVQKFMHNPLRIAAWEIIKQRRSDILFGKADQSDILLDDIITNIPTLLGPSKQFMAGGYASRIRFNGFSSVRLAEPHRKKVGGGVRVKSVTMYDNWTVENSATIDNSMSYKQVYDYTITEDAKTISSGVAIEPQEGREEDANYKLYLYIEKIPMGEDNQRFIKGHPLDVLAGGPSVTYRKVTVKTDYSKALSNMNLAANAIELSKVGHVEYEYNSAYDYPSVMSHSKVSPGGDPISFPISVTGVYSYNKVDNMMSQGYSLVNNGMQGTLKSIREFDRNNNSISGQVYKYKTKKVTVNEMAYDKNYLKMIAKSKVIHVPDNEISTIDKTEKVQKRTVGEDPDIWVNLKENSSENRNHGIVQFNIDLQKAITLENLMPLILLPTDETYEYSSYVTVNKIINKKPILEQVTTVKGQSKIVTEYLLFDDLTASPVLTRVENEYPDLATKTILDDKEKIYKLVRPAYWEYNAFKPAYLSLQKELHLSSNAQNVGVMADGRAFIKLTKPEITQIKNSWIPGDYLSLTMKNNEIKQVYLDEINDVSNELYVYLDKVSFSLDIKSIKVFKSGYNNAYSASVGELVAKDFYVKGTTLLGNYVFDPLKTYSSQLTSNTILNTSALTFKGEWEGRCCSGAFLLDNPYINGSKNNWRPYQSYTYYDDRDYSSSFAHKTGVIPSYKHFDWQMHKTNPTGLPEQWVMTSEASKYNNHNSLVQQENALGLFSSSIYGYGDYLMIGTTGNAQAKETLVENFEQKDFESCTNSATLNLTNSLQIGNGTSTSISDEESHTGRYSLKVTKGNPIIISKNLLDCKKKKNKISSIKK